MYPILPMPVLPLKIILLILIITQLLHHLWNKLPIPLPPLRFRYGYWRRIRVYWVLHLLCLCVWWFGVVYGRRSRAWCAVVIKHG